MDAAHDQVVLTLDGGGSSFKAAVYSLSLRATIALASREVEADHSGAGVAEFDTATWWREAEVTMRQAVEAAKRAPSVYVGITCTGMRAPFVLLDRQGNAPVPGVLASDRRQGSLARIEDAIGSDEFYRLTGHWLEAGLGLPKLLWYAQQRPQLWREVRHVLQFHDWLIYRLSGALVSEPSSAAMSELLDVERRSWAPRLLDTLGLDSRLFPDLHDGGQEVGGLLPTVARETGLRTGTPVYVGAGDTHLAALGAGAAMPGTTAIVGGSTTPVLYASAEPQRFVGQHRPFVSPHTRPGVWAVETNAGATGVLYTWLRDLVGGAGNGCSYGTLDALAERATVGAGGLFVTGASPYWDEKAWKRMPPPTLLGVAPRHRLGDLARAVLESIAQAVRSNLDTLESALGAPASTLVFTGGASRNVFGCKLLADVLGRTLSVPDVEQPAAIGGAVLIAGEQARGEQAVAVYEPDPERAHAYVEHAIRYRDAYTRLQEGFGK